MAVAQNGDSQLCERWLAHASQEATQHSSRDWLRASRCGSSSSAALAASANIPDRLRRRSSCHHQFNANKERRRKRERREHEAHQKHVGNMRAGCFTCNIKIVVLFGFCDSRAAATLFGRKGNDRAGICQNTWYFKGYGVARAERKE